MRAASRRGAAAARPSALSTPQARGQMIRSIPSSLGERDGVQRAGAAERHQREAARIDAALHGHHAQRAQHLGARRPARSPRHSGAASGRARAPAGRSRARPRRGPAAARRPVARLRAGARAAGWRRSPSAVVRRVRSRPDQDRRPPTRGPTRSAPPESRQAIDRRRLRRCGCRASVARAAARRPIAPRSRALVRRRSGRRRTRFRPCRSTARRAPRPARQAQALRRRRRRARTARSGRRARRPARQSVRPPRGLHDLWFAQAAVTSGAGQSCQIAGQQRRQRRVELGRRSALVLAKGAHQIVRQRQVHVAAAVRGSTAQAATRARGGRRSAAARQRPPRPQPAR